MEQTVGDGLIEAVKIRTRPNAHRRMVSKKSGRMCFPRKDGNQKRRASAQLGLGRALHSARDGSVDIENW
jgi:hypothetical protein